MSGSSSLHLVSPSLSIGGDFTIECWAKVTTWSSIEPMLFAFKQSLYVSITSSLVDIGDGVAFSTSTNQWYHYAMIRAGSDVSFFIDGARVVQVRTSRVLRTSGMRIGGFDATTSDHMWPGSIADFRIVNGTALYM